eukprot:sb/3461211/
MNLSLENWILQNWNFTRSDCLLVYRNKPCVVIGRFQNPWREVNVTEAQEKGIDIARRVSGGGTVYHDLGNVNFSFFTDKPSHCPAKNLTFLADTLNQWADLGLKTNKRHDMSIGEAKVTGSASRIIRTGSFHHCTVLVTSSLSSLSSVLHGDPHITTSIATASVPSPVTNLAAHSRDVIITPGHVITHVTSSYLARYDVHFPEPELPWTPEQDTAGDVMVVDELPEVAAEPDHQTWGWVFGRTPKFIRSFGEGVNVVVDKGIVVETMGRRQKKTKVGNDREMRAVTRNFSRGTGPDLKTVGDKKLRRELIVKEKKNAMAVKSAALAQLMLPEETGCLEADEGERTMKFKQHDIVKHVDVGSARKHFSLTLPEHGPYKCAYTKNGRKLLIGGAKGHIGTFDWQTGALGCEIHVRETIRDVVWLHNKDFFAVAQKKYTYIYDGSGTELHRLQNHINPVFLDYLPYHWLLVSAGVTGYLKYHDTSVGKLVVELKTRMGQPHAMAQNPWNAVMHLGHANGTVSMWSPSMKEPLVKMLCHHGPVTILSLPLLQLTTKHLKLLIGGAKGHIGTFDWQTGALGCEIHVRETIRDVVWLHNKDFFAVAQKKYTYIYDGSGTELHRLQNHINPVFLDYLPYHWLLVSAGVTGYLKYHDTSVGKLVVELKTRMGQPHAMAQNPWNAVMHLGHANGTVSMWSPSMKEPLVKMLCHHGPVTAIASDNTGRHMVTCGMDNQLKIWDIRSYKNSLSYHTHRPGGQLAVSATGLIATSLGGLVQVYNDVETGCLEADEGERTMKFKQHDIVKHVDVGSARKHFSLTLPEHGPYKCAYTKNGRKLLIGGAKGHIGTFDWQTGALGCEIHVRETIRDVVWLHNKDFFAVAQKKYTYIYDGSGTELHRLQNHINPVFLDYLPYHWLLVSAGVTGYLKYHDTSVGKLVVELKTRMGQPHAMAQNPWNAVMHLGHANGTVSMWSPSMKEPLVKMLCHHGPVTAIASDNTGRHMVTCGMDNQLKIWDIRSYKNSLSYHTHRPGGQLAVSATGLIATSLGGLVQVWKDSFSTKQKCPYMTHRLESGNIEGLQFAPFEDVLGVGHTNGFTSLLIPGAGQANFDALEANPYENKRQKQEAEVKNLLSKIQPELISLDSGNILQMKSTEEPAKELTEKELVLKFKMKGRNSAKKRFLRKEKHINDERGSRIRAALDKEREAREEGADGEGESSSRTPLAEPGILDRFKSKD